MLYKNRKTSEAEGDSTTSKGGGPYLQYLADPAVNMELSHTLLPANDVNSVEEPVEYPVGHSIVPQDNTD